MSRARHPCVVRRRGSARRARIALPGVVGLASLILLGPTGPPNPPARASDSTPAEEVYLPVVLSAWGPYICPAYSDNEYDEGTAYQYDSDDPVRPAAEHADKNLALRSYDPNPDPDLKRELVATDSRPPVQPPQLATLFSPARVPDLAGSYRANHWQWSPFRDPGSRGNPIASPR